jgi:hypothetical protein
LFGQHAWLRLPDGTIWDPTEDAYIAADEYAATYCGTPIRVYTRLQAAKLAAKHDHCGPWYPDKLRWQVENRFWRKHCSGLGTSRVGTGHPK